MSSEDLRRYYFKNRKYSNDYRDYVIKKRKFIGASEEMLKLIKMDIVKIIELNRLTNSNAIILFRKRASAKTG